MGVSAEEFLGQPAITRPPDASGAPSPAAQPTTAEQFLDAPRKRAAPGATGTWAQPGEGLSFADKAALAAHDSVSEREMYLQKVYGKGAVRRQWGEAGQAKLILTKEGKDIEIPSDFGFLAEMAGHSPELAGMTVGAGEGGALGAPLGPLGVAGGALIGAGVGALEGYAAKQVAKEAAGTYQKTPGEAVKQAGKAAAEGVIGEAGGRVLGAATRKVLSGRLPSFFTGATAESRAATERAWAGGAKPPYASMAPDARKLARIEVDAEKITGKYATQDKVNQAYVLAEIRKTLQDQGLPPPQIDALMKQLQDPTFQFSGREAGETLQQAVRAQAETLEHHIKQAGETGDVLIDARLSNIDAIIEKHPAGMLADDVSALVRNAKQQFSRTASDIYERVHDMLGGAAVVPTDVIREAAKQITGQLPKSILSALTREMSRLAKRNVTPEDAVLLKEFGIEIPTDKISLKDAQRIRTVLRERGDAEALLRNTTRGDHLFIANAVDAAIQAAAEDPAATAAIAALNAADEFYKNGIRKFSDTAIKQLVKSTRAGMPPDAEKIVAIIAGAGQSARVGGIRKLVGEDVWKRVQAVHLNSLVKNTSSLGETSKRVVDGMKLLRYLKGSSESVINAIHGPERVADLTEIALSLGARKGTLDTSMLAQGDIRGALQVLRTSEQRLDDYLKGNLLAELANPTKTGEDVFRWAVEPGKETRIMEVARQFGFDSPQMAELRQAALEELARNASMKAINEKGNQALISALNEFTQRQQEMLFPGGLAEDIRKLGDVIKFIYPFKSGVARDVGMAGMHAGAVLEKPLRQRLYQQATAALTRYIALHPTVARWIVTGRDPKTPWIHKAAQTVEGLVRAEIARQTPDQPEPVPAPGAQPPGPTTSLQPPTMAPQ